jgi:hypothetical protein
MRRTFKGFRYSQALPGSYLLPLASANGKVVAKALFFTALLPSAKADGNRLSFISTQFWQIFE